MRNFDKQKDYWKPCRPGTILKAVDTKFQRERRRFLIRSAMGVVIGSAGIFSAFFIANNGSRRRLARLDSEQTPDVVSATNRGNENTLVAQSTERKKFTCGDIKTNLDGYVAAFRLPDDQRSKRQAGLMIDFENHLKVCHKCVPMVNNAINADTIG